MVEVTVKGHHSLWSRPCPPSRSALCQTTLVLDMVQHVVQDLRCSVVRDRKGRALSSIARSHDLSQQFGPRMV
jgi:hypothetical protein